ncbi:molybdopterin-dependent oxidoreductase [Shewanella avicenniae]|uniref:Molybdopterin-dependent oxidoreductase n=1 Tax=Shewanella avicenniae TaxID=2814294 RepID=A0ABX7QSK3_9GAMM|nr:DMSO/selenate family reductase complex A subunit [Shewanella avicenniae]QSX33853.1 molybdopterin-dependent oxidoreductase [Shewanella avicenniae]
MERRSFLKMSAALSAAATVSGCNSSSKDIEEVAPSKGATEEVMNWSACLCNCGSNCPLKVFSKDGKIVRIETDDTGDDSWGNHQIRACARGRSNRKRVYNPDRLLYPMKQMGERGDESTFQRITWEQAISEIGSQLKGIYDTYGARSVLRHYASGAYYDLNGSNAWQRLLNCMGGSLGYYGSYSSAQVGRMIPLIYGSGARSTIAEVQHSDLCFFIGYNPLEMRQSGSGEGYEFNYYREKNNIKTIIIDCRYSDSLAGKDNMEYHACRPGTDAAMISGMAYHLITNNLIDENFLTTKCYGFRAEDALPEKGLEALPYERSYEAYILGVGELDNTPKTPEWAAAICGVPADQIRQLAEQLAAANAPYIALGYGVQRQANGEYNVWAASALAMLVGAVGKRGTNTGGYMPNSSNGGISSGMSTVVKDGPALETAQISVFTWPDAILDGKNMTVFKDGVMHLSPEELDADGNGRLNVDIKAIINFAGNTLINQHSDCFGTAEILKQKDKCELIVVSENHMTPSAKFADYLLPDSTWLESEDIANGSYSSGSMGLITPMTTSLEPLGDCRKSWEVCAALADVMGVGGLFHGGLSYQETLEKYYVDVIAPKSTELPATLQEFQNNGKLFKKFKENSESECGLYGYVQNGGELATASGRIELFSHAVDFMSKHWEKPDYVIGLHIPPIPAYIVTWEGYEDPSPEIADMKLQLIGHHTKGRTHSSFHSVQWLREATHDAVWVNPADAKGFVDGDYVIVESLRGKVRVKAHVTNRIMPGVCDLAQGAWFKPENGVDVGGCVNTLTAYRPSPIAKANPQHTNRVRIYKA